MGEAMTDGVAASQLCLSQKTALNLTFEMKHLLYSQILSLTKWEKKAL